MKYDSLIRLDDLIDFIKNQRKEFDYCIYGKGSSDEATLRTLCVVGEYPEITDDDEEVFPDYVQDNSLEFWFRDELLEDVVMNAVAQKSLVNNEEILGAIKYYNNNDDFMDIA
ncbi:hypothetical protein BZL41_02720 [Pseudomonas sp. PIC25]|uniref:DUF7716 domain-containing protein n=1 Tax=Pseudomonas sp. PIC25 TaxID=1958773 RepID=UPI000BAB3E87|nr:hypothetical protein [Pseudomonas sp. PIC25]PAU66251.1 hypothetical protein BZL41_02720 [Pseudomonas sp. PIC25]